jgi:iron complex outermembrane receptor protein
MLTERLQFAARNAGLGARRDFAGAADLSRSPGRRVSNNFCRGIQIMQSRVFSISLALATLVAGATATAQTAQPSSELQEIVVTGSLIKRTDTETPSPVQVITAQDLKDSGYTNVSDVLRNLSANGSGTLNQGFGQAFAAGATGIALRGLSVGNTLTLIDGERMVNYPLSDDGERSFVDVSAIPFNAVDTIEVLKDGASHCMARMPLPVWSTSN